MNIDAARTILNNRLLSVHENNNDRLDRAEQDRQLNLITITCICGERYPADEGRDDSECKKCGEINNH